MCSWSRVVVLGISMLLNTFVGTAHRGELQMRHGKSSVTSVCNLPNGKQFISASYDGTVIMWDMVSGKPTWQVDLDEKSKSTDSHTISHILGMDLSPNGDVVAISYFQNHVVQGTLKGNANYQIALLDSRTGQVNRILTGHTALIGRVAFSPDGELLLSESGDSTARLWNVKTGQEVLQIKLKEKGASVAFSPNGKVLAVATQPVWGLPPVDTVGLYDSRTGQLVREFPRTKNEVASLAFSPDGQVLAIASGDAVGAQIDLWRLTGQDSPLTIALPRRKIKIVRFSPDGQSLALGGYHRARGLVEIRDTSANAPVRTFALQGEVTALDFTPDGKQLVVGTNEGQISLLSLQTPRP